MARRSASSMVLLLAQLVQLSEAVPADFECAWRRAAYAYANTLQPNLTPEMKGILVQSLSTDMSGKLVPNCEIGPADLPQLKPGVAAPLPQRRGTFTSTPKQQLAPPRIVIDPGSANCSDSAAGTVTAPLCSIEAGVAKCRLTSSRNYTGNPVSLCTVALRAGAVHRVRDTITLTAHDSGLTISGFPGDDPPVVSGAQLITPSWTPVGASAAFDSCTVFNHTDCKGSDLPGMPLRGLTAKACVAACAARCDCAAGVWGYTSNKKHNCYLKRVGSTIATRGATPNNVAFACKPSCGPGTGTLWKTDLPADVQVATLLRNGVRAIPARYPNANPEVDKFPTGYIKSATWLPPRPLGTPKYINYTETRPDYVKLFQNYRAGVGGPCSVYDPPLSYWCAETTQGGGAAEFVLPSGLTYNEADLPNAPYKSVDGAIIWSWRPGHWANWAFAVDKQLPEGGFSWTRGGFQGGRGNRHGAEWYIENVREELDAPNEWYVDKDAGELLFVSSGEDHPSGTFEAASLKTLFELRGTQASPVRNVTFSGIHFTGSAPTFLDPHGVPSGGDWAFQRSAALFFEGTTGCTIEKSRLERLDGNAILLSGFNQYTRIAANHFAYTGDTAIGAWGYTSGNAPGQPEGTGPDGTAGNFPRFTLVENNFIHHLGIHEKQSSCWFQAKTAQTTLRGNICFEIPRAGYNFNDGFGGGNEVANNLLFNTCGESGDHGAINTWDRQAFLTDVANPGVPSYRPLFNDFHHNFIVSDGDADGGAIDNDDGSSFYNLHHNFCVYGGAKMGNIDGHGKRCYENIHAYANVYGKTCFWNWPGWFPEKVYEEQYFNNTCILDDGQNYISMPSSCSFKNVSTVGAIAHGNTVVVNGTAMVKGCGESITVEKWLELGADPRTTVRGPLTSSEIVERGAALLGFKSD